MENRKTALITGMTGQDGPYLADFLLGKGYDVHGLIRSTADEDQDARLSRISRIRDRVKIHYGDITDPLSICLIAAEVEPDEVYHLAAQSFVGVSFKDEAATMRINEQGTHNLLATLNAFRKHKKRLVPENCRFYFAATSEMFGGVGNSPQSENTPFNPRSPYGISKVNGFQLTKFYREAHELFACSGILFNHESPRRGHQFVTRKITLGAARIKAGLQECLYLGNLDAKRDWGFAGDYVEAMWLMLQQEKPADHVIGTGEMHSVREFVQRVFSHPLINLDWERDKLVRIDKEEERPLEVYELRADASLARKKLGWEPKVKFEELVEMMVRADCEKLGIS